MSDEVDSFLKRKLGRVASDAAYYERNKQNKLNKLIEKYGIDGLKIYRKDIYLKSKYGITIDDYSTMLKNQNNKCAICGKDSIENNKALAVDHCHTTGNVRELLCSKCNFLLWHSNESIIILTSLIKFLKNSNSKFNTFEKYIRKKEYDKNPILNKEYFKDADLKTTFGISLKQYNKMLKFQKFKCKVCNKTKEENGQYLSVDHCHKTGIIRGILCSCCNSALFDSNEDTDILKNAIRYISKHTIG